MGLSWTSTATISLALLGQAFAIEPIVMKGSKFFYNNGTQFYIKGIAYQQGIGAAGSISAGANYSDPLRDGSICARDVPLMQALGTNAIRTYAIDPTADHSECMKMLSDAGIYVISDLSEPVTSINRDDPSWDVDLYKRYTSVVDELSKYDNVIGFFAGNEVTNQKNNTNASAFVKAAVRDTKNYIKSKVPRWMGVGYAANDDADIRANIANYFNCGNQSEAIDYWGYNIYEWCGESTIEQSGYAKQIEFFKGFSVPVFFAEYGCNQNGGAAGRIWQETTALYSNEMTGVFSGGIVYMYFQEENDFGLVSVSGGQASTMRDYDALKTVMASVAPTAVAMDSYQPTNSPAACPSVSSDWEPSNDLPPTPDEATCQCMFETLSCVPASNLALKDFKQLFDNVCGLAGNPCAGIKKDPGSGVFGAYSMCNPTQKLGHVLDTYFKSRKSNAADCDWDGAARVVQPAGTSDSGCEARLSSASSTNNFAATATAAAESSNIAVPLPMRNAFTIGDFAIGLYVFIAMIAGAGFIIL